MTTPSSEEFLRPYRDAVRDHGTGFESTLWGSREAQQIRFDVMRQLVPMDGLRLADVGCGPGALADDLIAHGVDFAAYVGIDALGEVIAEAAKAERPRCTFIAADVLQDDAPLVAAAPDLVTISGTLNTMDDETAQRLVARCFEIAAQGIVFNFLSDRPHPRWTVRDLTPARRFSTVGWLDWAFGLTSCVSFTQDYLDGHDATVYLRHDG